MHTYRAHCCVANTIFLWNLFYGITAHAPTTGFYCATLPRAAYYAYYRAPNAAAIPARLRIFYCSFCHYTHYFAHLPPTTTMGPACVHHTLLPIFVPFRIHAVYLACLTVSVPPRNATPPLLPVSPVPPPFTHARRRLNFTCVRFLFCSLPAVPRLVGYYYCRWLCYTFCCRFHAPAFSHARNACSHHYVYRTCVLFTFAGRAHFSPLPALPGVPPQCYFCVSRTYTSIPFLFTGLVTCGSFHLFTPPFPVILLGVLLAFTCTRYTHTLPATTVWYSTVHLYATRCCSSLHTPCYATM